MTDGAVVVASGGVGANLDLIRQYWPERLGAMPRDVVVGVPASDRLAAIAVA